MGSKNKAATKPSRKSNAPCFDGKALTILILILSLIIAAIWFGHARLQTRNNPSVQDFVPASLRR